MKKLLFLLPVLFIVLSSFITTVNNSYFSPYNETKKPRPLPEYDVNLDLHLGTMGSQKSSCSCSNATGSCSKTCEGDCNCSCDYFGCLCLCGSSSTPSVKNATSGEEKYIVAPFSINRDQYANIQKLSSILTSFQSSNTTNSQELLVDMIELLKKKDYQAYGNKSK